jgi:hypothetical protein
VQVTWGWDGPDPDHWDVTLHDLTQPNDYNQEGIAAGERQQFFNVGPDGDGDLVNAHVEARRADESVIASADTGEQQCPTS